MAPSPSSLQPLRTLLRREAARLRPAPCLLITSVPPPAESMAVAGTRNPASIAPSLDERERQEQSERLRLQQLRDDKRVNAFLQRNVQSLTMEFNLRTVPCTISSAFPTREGVEEAVSLALRAGVKGGSGGSGGEGTIVGVGSGAAIDLAKAVADSLFGRVAPHCENGSDSDSGGSLILAPATPPGLWAAVSNSPSLLLDTKEGVLLPHLPPSFKGHGSGAPLGRRGAVVTLDPPRQLFTPPLYAPFRPSRGSDHSTAPPMAHLAAAVLAVLMDAARIVDAVGEDCEGVATHPTEGLRNEMKSVAASCARVLGLAAQMATARDDGPEAEEGTVDEEARLLLVDVLPRLSPILEQCSLLAGSPISRDGTLPQRLTCALLPTHFPRSHYVTLLASALPGLCDALSEGASLSHSRDASMMEAVTQSMMSHGCINENFPAESFSAWISRTAMGAGIPPMASLADGAPDPEALVGSLDAYEALTRSMTRSLSTEGVGCDHLLIKDFVQRSLSR